MLKEHDHINITNLIVNDITQINPIPVNGIFAPKSVAELKKIFKSIDGNFSIGGGQYSMGGQTAAPNTYQLDLRSFNDIIDLDVDNKTITVEPGIRWNDIQPIIQEKGLSIKIMQTYANFTVAGSLSVNVHGRYMGLGPIISSVKSLKLLTVDGKLHDCSRTKNKDIFYGVVGCYGALGIIVEVTLELVEDCNVEQINERMDLEDYVHYFKENIRNNEKIVFHNADLFPPHFNQVNAVSWRETHKPLTTTGLQKQKKHYLLEKYFAFAFSETPFGKWRRQYLYNHLFFMKDRIHTKNYEANYNAMELEPLSRENSTYVLQEYFIPIDKIESFTKEMTKIYKRFNANIINISLRHAYKDEGSLLSWADEEVIAFVVYYKQGTTEAAKMEVGVWTREMIDLINSYNGRYYLPYQPHATIKQFKSIYKKSTELFKLKDKYDPKFKLRNSLWEKYYKPEKQRPADKSSLFKRALHTVEQRDNLYNFLQNVFKIYPTAEFANIIFEETKKNHVTDDEIYMNIQNKLADIKPLLADITLGIPTLFKQKRTMIKQTLKMLNQYDYYESLVEIETNGMYASDIMDRKRIGQVTFINDDANNYSLPQILERKSIMPIGRVLPLNNWTPITKDIADNSTDIVTYYGGLHHMSEDKLRPFIASISRILKPGGKFILREHDVKTESFDDFACLIHKVFNCGTGESLELENNELRHFRPVSEWVTIMEKHNLMDDGFRELQDNDPSDNVLLCFTKSLAKECVNDLKNDFL
jgi:FAD/FMN-containing dehydrogenase